MPSTILNSIVMPNDQAEVDMHGATSSPVIVKAPVVGSDGKPITKANLADYPLPDLEASRKLNAPMFHGGVPLSKTALASEAQAKRHTFSEKYQRISRSVPMMRIEYDVVVIGSGYGGAVAASRMARAGKSVCLLELGKERWPGEFPVDLVDAAPELHVTGNIENEQKIADLNAGDPQGLYHLIVGEGQNAFVANGLGGTSLLNANIFIEADHRTLSQDIFPPEIRNNPSVLDEYYKRAGYVLQPEIYPEDWPKLAKLQVLEKQAELLGPEYKERFRRLHQTTTFKDGLNNMGVYQKKSTLTGQDTTGINDGSKNSTLMNYLPDAWNHGAEIFCGCEVRYIKPVTKGENKWTVHFAWHGDKRDVFKDSIYSELMWVQAKEFVFLGAGTMGTTEILLRSEAYGLKLPRSVGKNMSGNGDILAFGYNTDETINAIGTEDLGYLSKHPVGPCITGVIDMRDKEVAPNVLDGYIIEEGVVPTALAYVLQSMLEVTPDKLEPKHHSVHSWIRQHVSKVKSGLLGPWKQGGSLNRTMTYLIMSHDDNQATLSLEDNKPAFRFQGVARAQNTQRLGDILTKATSKIGGDFAQNPFYADQFGQSEITVHPLGGANMSSDGTGVHGVTNHLGQVFKGRGSEVYEGLVVVDGSVVPAALGVNPFATITALAERSVEAVAKAKGIAIDYESKNGVINWAAPKKCIALTADMEKAQNAISNSPMTGGARFTEIMEGFLYVGDDITEFDIAVEAAKGASSAAKFYLSVDAWDIDTLKYKENHAAMLTGTFSCGALSKDPLMVLRGEFQLFSDDSRTTGTKNLVYNFDMQSSEGDLYHFNGYKVVDPTIAFSAKKTWQATTTLYTTITRLDKSIVGRGILTISKRNFGNELLSFEAIGESTLTRICSAEMFFSYFMQRLSGSFFAPLDALQYPQPCASGYYQKDAPADFITLTAADGIESIMQMWVPEGEKCQNMPILLVPGASVDYQIFQLPTIPVDFVSYLLDRGYTVYCLNHRVGKTPAAKDNWTTYDARLDIAAATQHILASTGAPKIYAVVHCAGAVAMAAGLLDGTITGIGGLTTSQVFMQPWFAKVNQLKARIVPSIPTVYKKVFGSWFDTISGPDDGLVQDLINTSLRCYPVGKKEDICTSVVCHRSELAFGRLWSHQNFNEATHRDLKNFLGGVSMKNLEQLMFMGTHGYVVDNDENSLLTTENLQRLRDIPILFIHGEKNTCYSPESTMKCYDVLRHTFNHDSSLYERVVFESRGHLDCWMGKQSYLDVYPQVEQHARTTIIARGLVPSRSI